jgi:hypothetical protein
MASANQPFSVNLWSEDERHIEAVLDMAACLAKGRAAFDRACLCNPDRKLTLVGPGALEIRPAGQPLPVAKGECGSFGIMLVP